MINRSRKRIKEYVKMDYPYGYVVHLKLTYTASFSSITLSGSIIDSRTDVKVSID